MRQGRYTPYCWCSQPVRLVLPYQVSGIGRSIPADLLFPRSSTQTLLTSGEKAEPMQAPAPQACATPCEVRAGASYSLEFTHDGKDADGFRIYLASNGGAPVKVGNDIALTVLQSGAVLMPLTAPNASGTYEISVSAYGKGGETVSKPYQFKVFAAPNAPGNLKIYIVVSVAADGTVQFKIADVTPTK